MSNNILFIVGPLVFIAGFIDSIAGGGGLISLPAFLACGLPSTLALGTNKFSAFIGSTMASANYIRTKNVDFASAIPSVAVSILASKLGSYCALLINERVFKMIMLIVTPIVAVTVLLDKNYSGHEKEMTPVKRAFICSLVCLVVGLYDGLYGPGTGTFMTMGFIVLAGISVKKSCGNAKLANWGSNLGALITFIPTGNVVYRLAIPCALCSIAGNYLGSKLAIKKDVKVVKPVLIVVVIILFVKILLDFLGFTF